MEKLHIVGICGSLRKHSFNLMDRGVKAQLATLKDEFINVLK
ncbi:hypothetical protein ABES03_16950 [Neobacillus rhizosphaerae]